MIVIMIHKLKNYKIMFKLSLKFSSILFLFFAFLMISCEKEATLEDVENYVNNSIYGMEKDANAGRFGCVEFVFPIDILFPDETSTSVDSYEELKEAIKAWKEENPDTNERPSLAFPLEVINQDGEIISISSRDELKQLKRDCIGNHDMRPGRACFRLIMPLSIEFPNGEIFEFESRKALRHAIRTWKENHPDADVRPHLVYPVSVKFRDGTIIEVGSPEELRALKEECRG